LGERSTNDLAILHTSGTAILRQIERFEILPLASRP
jgi:hypothetical protein